MTTAQATTNDLTIHTYTAAEPGLFVNSYLLETELAGLTLGPYLHQAPLSWMIGLGADAVATELAAETGAAA